MDITGIFSDMSVANATPALRQRWGSGSFVVARPRLLRLPFVRPEALLLFLPALVIPLAVFIATSLPAGVDFRFNFYPAGQAALAGQNMYLVNGFYTPPWIAVVLAPLALLPLQASWAVFTLLSLGAFLVTFHRMGLTRQQLVLLALSPFVLFNLWHGNLDSFVLLGSVLSPAAGVWLLLLKPQLTWPLIALWLFRCRKNPKSRSSITFVVSFLIASAIAGVAAFPHLPDPQAMPWNTSLWPISLPLGLILLVFAARYDDEKMALASAPLLSPYLAIHSWLLTTLPFLRRPLFLAGFVALAWVAVTLRAVYTP